MEFFLGGGSFFVFTIFVFLPGKTLKSRENNNKSNATNISLFSAENKMKKELFLTHQQSLCSYLWRFKHSSNSFRKDKQGNYYKKQSIHKSWQHFNAIKSGKERKKISKLKEDFVFGEEVTIDCFFLFSI